MQMNYLCNFKFTFLFFFVKRGSRPIINFSFQSSLPLMLENLTFTPTLFGDPSLCAVEQLNQISYIQNLDENYLVPNHEPIMMGKSCWLDAYMYSFMRNKPISYQILFGNFVLITNSLAISGDIQFLLN